MILLVNSKLEITKRKCLWPNLWYICDVRLVYLRRTMKNSQDPKNKIWTFYTERALYKRLYIPS